MRNDQQTGSVKASRAGTSGQPRTTSKSSRTSRILVGLITGLAILPAALFLITGVSLAQQARGRTMQGADSEHAKRSFVAHCAPCHGLDGRGGEHAPAIVGTPAAQARTDERLAGIIRSGIPDKGMPSFHFLTNQQIAEIVSYIHVLHGTNRIANLKGDPAAGAKLFFGEARCSECHMMHGKGGFIGADLSEYGLTHTAGEIRQMIVDPNKVPMPQSQQVSVVTHSGQTFSGLVRAEDNFSIALLSQDGSFHLLMKSDITQMTREKQSIMPGDYGKRLTREQLDALAAYLILGSAKRPAAAGNAGMAASK